MEEYLYIAVDFDGTIVKDYWPEIGKENPYAIEVLKDLRSKGHKIILYTCRERELLTPAVEWMEEHGIAPDYVNDNPEARKRWGDCRKVYADIVIDDHNAFICKLPDGSVDWLRIKRQLSRLTPIDVVNNPSHYHGKNGIQSIDVIESFDLNFHLGNAVKYILRAGNKPGNSKKQDLSKAIWYLTRELENI